MALVLLECERIQAVAEDGLKSVWRFACRGAFCPTAALMSHRNNIPYRIVLGSALHVLTVTILRARAHFYTLVDVVVLVEYIYMYIIQL